jgi:hypothetical protein
LIQQDTGLYIIQELHTQSNGALLQRERGLENTGAVEGGRGLVAPSTLVKEQKGAGDAMKCWCGGGGGGGGGGRRKGE